MGHGGVWREEECGERRSVWRKRRSVRHGRNDELGDGRHEREGVSSE